MCSSYRDYFRLVCCHLHFCSFFYRKTKICFTSSILADIWKNPLAVVGPETSYISLVYVHCVSFRNELTNLSYIMSFGVNLGIHKRNLLTLTRTLSAALPLCINSSPLFSSMLNKSCMGTSILASSSSKKLYRFTLQKWSYIYF